MQVALIPFVVALYAQRPEGLAYLAPWLEGGNGKYAGQPILIMGGTSTVGQYGACKLNLIPWLIIHKFHSHPAREALWIFPYHHYSFLAQHQTSFLARRYSCAQSQALDYFVERRDC